MCSIHTVPTPHAALVYWQDVVSGGMDGGVFQRDHIVCLNAKARDREMKRMLDKHKAELAADGNDEYEPYTSARTGDKDGPHSEKIKIVD